MHKHYSSSLGFLKCFTQRKPRCDHKRKRTRVVCSTTEKYINRSISHGYSKSTCVISTGCSRPLQAYLQGALQLAGGIESSGSMRWPLRLARHTTQEGAPRLDALSAVAQTVACALSHPLSKSLLQTIVPNFCTPPSRSFSIDKPSITTTTVQDAYPFLQDPQGMPLSPSTKFEMNENVRIDDGPGRDLLTSFTAPRPRLCRQWSCWQAPQGTNDLNESQSARQYNMMAGESEKSVKLTCGPHSPAPRWSWYGRWSAPPPHEPRQVPPWLLR